MKHILIYILILLPGIVCSQPVDKNYLLGKFDPATHPQFVKLADEHTRGSARNAYLRKETYEAFVRMSEAALKDSVKLVIISATRNFDSQKRIWENKWNGKVQVEGKDLTTIDDPKERARLILLYSSMPSTSRHHWGTDMDLNALSNNFFDSGEGLKTYTWLKAHAAEYGFCQPYTSKESGRTGYEEERWHWSYLPLSGELLNEYKKQVTYADITGFEGSEAAKPMGVIKNYVEGVACKKER
ncbi:MAG: M15 family metallopeptidase [Cyclobacteriaceae bacterium]|nr:M15 family metallopeptidase [Cyclobacteriaceae bacterium]